MRKTNKQTKQKKNKQKKGDKNENTIIFSNMGVGWSTQTDRCSLFLLVAGIPVQAVKLYFQMFYSSNESAKIEKKMANIHNRTIDQNYKIYSDWFICKMLFFTVRLNCKANFKVKIRWK